LVPQPSCPDQDRTRFLIPLYSSGQRNYPTVTTLNYCRGLKAESCITKATGRIADHPPILSPLTKERLERLFESRKVQLGEDQRQKVVRSNDGRLEQHCPEPRALSALSITINATEHCQTSARRRIPHPAMRVLLPCQRCAAAVQSNKVRGVGLQTGSAPAAAGWPPLLITRRGHSRSLREARSGDGVNDHNGRFEGRPNRWWHTAASNITSCRASSSTLLPLPSR
jgi:hypothetical protein